ncbi:MAG: type I DNA topoisomerase [Candidatus Babeliaceae bacterium]|nr:type I DNA topoisomerase [Candidatus Babeliaceae bacterium]
MKKLLIVESPAKIKTISKFLGKDFVILSTLGHVKDLPQKELGIDIKPSAKGDGSLDLTYTVLDKKEKVIADICKAARTADEIYLAPDPDREGEIIAWHIAGEIEKVIKDPSIIHRITFNEITKTAIEHAIKHPGVIDENKVEAQQARRILDRLVGYEVSPILWRKISKGLSAGRVQSVALKLICDREDAIRVFKPEEYWSIQGTFDFEKQKFTAQLSQINKKKADIKDEATALSIIDKANKGSYLVDSIKDSARSRSAAAPFITSTLQQAAYNSLGFSVQKTMQVAQKLYEGVPLQDSSSPVALITYMRTDSPRIAESALKEVRSFIKDMYGSDYVPGKSLVYAKGGGQDAHEAIRPISVAMAPDYVKKYVSADEAKLYELIWKRFVACQMKPAEYAQRAVTIAGDNGLVFKVTGSTLLFDGFLRVYNEAEESAEGAEDSEKVSIPKGLTEKSHVDLDNVTPKQHFTQPPARFTEASLVKELEKEGIGRPSTYATIMKTIQARSYTSLDKKKKFIPTELGMAVTKILTENLPKIMSTQFTAVMEEDLDKIAHGTMKRNTLVFEFYTPFSEDLEKFRGEKGKQTEVTDITCPECKKHKLTIRFGKTGSFLGCLGYPECKFTSNFERDESGTIKLVSAQAPKLLEENCPQCGKPLRAMVGRFGPFIACSGYPECKYIHTVKANFACPLEGGDVIERSWKGKKFWGCKNYPKCKFSISGEIEQVACPQCKKQPYLLKRFNKDETVTLSCPDKECGYSKTE